MAKRNKGSPDLMDSSDFTLSSATEPDLSEFSPPDGNVKKITKHVMQRKQMAHDMQVMKIELNQRSLALENMKAEYESKEEEMLEKISELQHQKSILQTKLETELELQRTEARRRQENTKRDFEAALLKQMQLEEANHRLIEKAADLKRQLNIDALHISDEDYDELHSKPDREISVQEFVAMRFYEAIRPIERELVEFRGRLADIEEDKRAICDERNDLAEAYARERELHQALQEEYQKAITALADTKALVQHGNYKIENFDAVRDARDHFDGELGDLRERHSHLEVVHENLLKERDELLRDMATARQTMTLLTQDKEYLTKQNTDLATRNGHGEDRIQQLTRNLDEAKDAREELYEKYVHSRDEYKSQYEGRLRDELEQLRLRTDSEMERLKSTTKDMYERENRSLREQREEAFMERDRAESRYKEIAAKYDALQRDLTSIQSTADTRVGELLSDAKLKAFELERTNLMLEDAKTKQRELEMCNEKVQAKLETVTKEYYNLETSSTQRLVELETRLEENRAKLESYEAVENELDQVVMQAAEKCEEEDINMERVTFAFAEGAHLPSTARRRMQQSVHLARRVLALERKIREQTRELEVSKGEREKAQEEAERAHAMLNDVQQPYGYLVDTLRTRDEELAKRRDTISTLEAELRNVKRERNELSRVKNQMTADLETLLSQREELSMLKKLMADLKEQRNARSARQEANGRRRRGETVSFVSPGGDDQFKPPVSQFTKKSSFDETPPERTHILKQRNVEPTDHKKVYGTYYS